MMGNFIGKSQDVSCSSDDEDYNDFSILYNRKSATVMKTENIKTDAVHGARISSVNQRMLNINISTELINNVEEELDEYEKISLVYLLYDEADVALKIMTDVVEKNIPIIEDFLYKETDKLRWKKLLEAISVIKNYKVLKMIGFTKADMNERFLPHQAQTSAFITRIRKYLYCMFENFKQDNENMLLQHIKSDYILKEMKFIEYKYLEMYFIYFEYCNYIDCCNYDNITKHLKIMDFEDHSQTIKLILQSTQCTSPNMRDTDMRRMETDKISSLQNVGGSYYEIRKRSASNDGKFAEQEVYRMDHANPGVCLIMEYENFYTEPNKNLRHLVIKPEIKVETRTGTKEDSTRLRRLFQQMGFEVFYHLDQTHTETLEIIKRTAQNVAAHLSSFFLCILSHGVEGKIICCNSIPIDVETIKKLVSSPQLEGKPKVLVLQSCQGKELQTVNDDLTTDGPGSAGPSKRFVPGTSDILEIWSTVPGYASIRSTTYGSWFIQSFCKVLEVRRNKLHFGDMCIIVQKKVRDKKWKDKDATYVMDCQTKSTFAKILWLPGGDCDTT